MAITAMVTEKPNVYAATLNRKFLVFTVDWFLLFTLFTLFNGVFSEVILSVKEMGMNHYTCT